MSDPYVQANLGVKDAPAGGTSPLTDPNLGAHIVNSALLGLPSGIVNERGAGPVVNTLLGGLPEKLIEAAGGKDQLKQYLSQENKTADIIGSLLSPANLLGGSGILGNAAVQGGQQLLRSLNEGDENPLQSAAISGVMGGALGGAAKGLGKLTEKIRAKPTQVLEKLGTDANILNLATSAKAGKGLISDFFVRFHPEFGGVKNAEDDLLTVAKMSRERNLADPDNLAAFNRENVANYNMIDKAAQANNIVPVTLRPEIDKIPSVAKALKNSTINDQLDIALHKASGFDYDPTTLQYQQVGTPTFKETMDSLLEATSAAHRRSLETSPNDLFQKSNQAELSKALADTRDFLGRTATDAANKADPNLNLSWDDINDRYMTGLFWDKAGKKAFGSSALDKFGTGSESAFRTQGLSAIPKAMVGKMTGIAQRTIGNTLLKGTTGKMMESPIFAAGPTAAKATAADVLKAITPGGAKTQRILPALGGVMGQGAMNIPEEGETPIQYVPAEGAAVGPKAQALNLKYGYPSSSLDDAVYEGIDKLFNNVYRDRFVGYPEKEKAARERFTKAALEMLHSGPGGSLDMQVASRALFPSNPALQEQFTRAANTNFAIQMAARDGAFDMGFPWIFGGIKRNLPGNAPAAAAYSALEGLAGQVAGAPGLKRYAEIMNNLLMDKDEKMRGIENLFRTSDAKAWALYDNALKGKKR